MVHQTVKRRRIITTKNPERGGLRRTKGIGGRLHCPRERNLNDNSSRSTAVTGLRMGSPKGRHIIFAATTAARFFHVMTIYADPEYRRAGQKEEKTKREKPSKQTISAGLLAQRVIKQPAKEIETGTAIIKRGRN